MEENKKLQVIPLGGALEIGKNMTAFRVDDQILVVDAGLMFPEEEMLGVDIVIPDITYLEENADKVLAVVLTHGHEDHIGALPYLLRRIDVPIYGTPLTLGFVQNKLIEHKLIDYARLNTVQCGSVVELGDFTVEWVRVSHSIPDASCLIIETPVGTVVHTADFKFDQSPIDGNLIDMSRLARAGDQGVELLLCDTTNVEKPGFTPSESVVGETFERIFATATGRIIVAAFASNIHRIQQIFNVASKYGRAVAVIGRSMENNSRIAEELGYLEIPPGTRLTNDEISKAGRDETVIITTGSQGEPLSALSRMAMDEHKRIKIEDGDTVIISATPIPGNEDLVMRTINRLFKQGATVLYEPETMVHASGHGNQEDIRMMINLLKPQYMIPVHGEERHYHKFVELVTSQGYDAECIFYMNIGDVLEISDDKAEVVDSVAAGMVMVDGLGVGDVEDLVLRDRRHLAQDGFIIAVIGLNPAEKQVVSGPDMFSRGFVEAERAEQILEGAKERIAQVLQEYADDDALGEFDDIKAACRKAVGKYVYEHTHCRPMVVPVIMEA
ncbi:MAG: ribonuclease J [Armatimonadetes bacterium]|jgi:ribonuclease J|nr:ribonuclease J [Armatimonadota bacterium]